MNKFNRVAQTVLKEEKYEHFTEISKALRAHGLKAFEVEPILELVQKAIMTGYREGYKAAESNPFRK
jgi:hypothetical protein